MIKPLPRVQATRPWQVEVKGNDNLTLIAQRWYPGQRELGLVALLMANPQNLNANLIIVRPEAEPSPHRPGRPDYSNERRDSLCTLRDLSFHPFLADRLFPG